MTLDCVDMRRRVEKASPFAVSVSGYEVLALLDLAATLKSALAQAAPWVGETFYGPIEQALADAREANLP